EPPHESGDHGTRFAMPAAKSWIIKSWVIKSWVITSWITSFRALLLAFVLGIAPSVSSVHAVEHGGKVGVVSFGLFGDQGVFRREATGAAQIVAGRFETGRIDVQYNSRKGGGATVGALAKSLQVAASGLDAENDVLFVILTSHGSPDGLAVKA